ncbi:MAG: MotA/TolQ/ExbB proton channel family protein [Planctomycetes bacterium]|nr:MotA/TolQ/ExbB proton channel family protein [Planctomycetota bacterium]
MSPRVTRFLSALSLLAAVTFAAGLYAAEEGGGGGAQLSLLGMIISAGAPEFLLIAFSVLAFAIAIQNFMVIKKEAIIPNGLAEDLHNVLSKDGPTEESIENARAMVDNDPSMTGKVLSASLAVSDLGYDAMLEAAEDTTTTESLRWLTKPGYLALFANQATLLGLFGTVWGIIESFMAMAANPAGVDIVQLSKTIGVSLVTTANGMAIAVPMLAFAFMQRTKLSGFFRESNDAVKEILNYFRAPVKG